MPSCLPHVLQRQLLLIAPQSLPTSGYHSTVSTLFTSSAPRSSSSRASFALFLLSQTTYNPVRTRSRIISKITFRASADMASRAGVARQKIQEDPLEAEGRKDADFLKVEALLFEKLTMAGASSVSPTALLKLPGVFIEGAFSWLGDKNPLIRNAKAGHNDVWILDNTGYKAKGSAKWQSEVVACYFQHGRYDITKAAAGIIDAIGLDGEAGASQASQKLIESRLRPFVDAIAPARTLPVVVNIQGGQPLKHQLGPSNTSGISDQVFEVGRPDQSDGSVNQIETDGSLAGLPSAKGVTRLAVPEGFGIISDIDDTIKITQTPDPIGILKTTFAEPAQYTSHMPDFYKILNEQLHKPCWFYVSASPYNLYPFLHKFIDDYYPKGTMMLRDASWQTLGGLLGSLTQGTKDYKTSRIEKIHQWLPNRKFICIGDSTQMDPETYAAMYKKYPGWISAIYIRKVLDAPYMEKKNLPERFEKAFEGIPSSAWRVFVLPDELVKHVSQIAGEARLNVTNTLSTYSCGKERQKQQLEKDRVTFH